jgi:GTP pyrophosphokinase
MNTETENFLTPDQEQQRNEQEKKEILKEYRALLKALRPQMKTGDAKTLKKAFNMAAEGHKDVRRKSGEPYIYHPLAVARIVVDEMGLGVISAISALLHDVVEDTDFELKDIEASFGKSVSKIVDGLTKVSTVSNMHQSKQAETFRKVVLTISDDIRVILVKIADRLHNMRTLESVPKHKRLKTKAETQYLYAPLAHRLGLYNIKSELEDLSFKYSNEDAYAQIANNIKRKKASMTRFVNDFIKPIKNILKKDGIKFTMQYRIKAVSSIWKKMQKQDIPFDEVFDVFAIRIIIDTAPGESEKRACWNVYSIVTDIYTPDIDRLRDWIGQPRPSGYESLHTTVMSKKGQWVEVQIRTARMDEIAEKGYAAHWKYKGGKSNDKGIDKWLADMRALIENKDVDAVEFMDQFQSSLFNKEVNVFTPTGDIKSLRRGATILDFAFEIHSEVGAHCMGGKINGKLVPLDYELKNGDKVEIIKSSQAKVNSGWLEIVQTSKAKNIIKNYTRKEDKEKMSDGKEIVKRKLKQLKLTLNDQTIHQLLDFFQVRTPSDFYLQVANGKIEHSAIKKFKDSAEKFKDTPKDAKKVKEKIRENAKKENPKKEALENQDILLVGDGKISGIEYSFAECCNPIPGDDIFGIVTVSRGIRIHRNSCNNARQIMVSFGDRIMNVGWKQDKTVRFDVHIELTGTDRQGMANEVTQVISTQLHINISYISMATNHGIFDGKIGISVLDKQQVKDVIQELSAIEGINSVRRREDLR